MDTINLKNVIQGFFEKDFSKHTQFLFRKWFRTDENRAEKEAAMAEIWESSPSVISAQTMEDLSRMRELISDTPMAKPRISLSRRIITYAAVIAILIASSVFLTYRLAVPASLEYCQLSVSFGESKKITLSDGSVVAVNAGSTLIYPKDFTTDTRIVFLVGEANFRVAKNPKKPFIVKTKYLDVRALGTKFNVQSYPNADYTKATLVEGSVKVDMEQDKAKSFILEPNNQLTYSHHDQGISITNVDAADVTSWEDGYLIFKNASFEEIVRTLENKYNVVINFDGEKFNKRSYFIKFKPNQSVQQVMDVLCLMINGASYKMKDKTIYLYAK